MQRDLEIKNTITAWLLVKGHWPTRLDVMCLASRDLAIKAFKKLRVTNPDLRIERAHLVLIKGQWHRVTVNPVLCEVSFIAAKERVSAIARKIKNSLIGSP